MKKRNYKKIYLIIISLIILSSATAVFAIEYTKLEPNAFAGFNPTPSDNSLGSFLANVFNLGIAAAVVLSLVMIIWGGIEYMTTDSWNGKEDGKTKIQEALEGLGLALISYLILFTINPCLVIWNGKSDVCSKANTFLFPPEAPAATNSATNTGLVDVKTLGLTCKNDCLLNKTFAENLSVALRNQGAQITEGSISTADHNSSCHSSGQGLCADINLIATAADPNKKDPNRVASLYNSLVSNGFSGNKIVYEVRPPGNCNQYITAGVKAEDCVVNPDVTANSFHVNAK